VIWLWLAFTWASNLLALWVTSLIFDGVTYDDKFWRRSSSPS
jgi:hypothetical protein